MSEQVEWVNLKICYQFHFHKILLPLYCAHTVQGYKHQYISFKNIFIIPRKQYYRMIRIWRRKEWPIIAFFKATVMLHAFLTSLLKCLYNFTHLHLYISIPICFFFIFFFFFYNRTLYHKYSVLHPNLCNYRALPHCIGLKPGLHKVNSWLSSVPPLWTVSPVHTCRNVFHL